MLKFILFFCSIFFTHISFAEYINIHDFQLSKLVFGKSHKQIEKIKMRFNELGLLEVQEISKTKFDDDLKNALKTFQEKNNLEVSGKINEKTLFLLFLTEEDKKNIYEDYKKQLLDIQSDIDLNKYEKAIIVNIPSYQLHMYEGGKKTFTSNVIIGKKTRKTPIGKMKIISIKYNPTWTPPNNIIKKDIYPALKKQDEKFFKSHPLTFIDKETGEELEWFDVDYDFFVEGGYKIIQDSGDSNALGRLKFETDSKESVYLHDTNSKSLFKKPIRAYSSGCIRVESFQELAARLLNKDEDYVVDQINKEKTFWEKVKPVPVYTMYSLLDYTNDQKAVYHPDIYSLMKNENVAILKKENNIN